MVSALSIPRTPAGAHTAPKLRLSDGLLTCETVEGIDTPGPHVEAWDGLVAWLDSPIEMTYDWCRTWWRHYGAERTSRVFLFRDEGELVGVVPVCLESVRVGPCRIRLARLLGSDHTTGLCDVPIEPSWMDTAMDTLVDELITRHGCDAVHLGPLSRASACSRAAVAAARRLDGVSIVRDHCLTAHTTVPLPDHFNLYLAGLSRNLRQSIRKAWKRLTSEHEVHVETCTNPEDAVRELDSLATMHSAQWSSEGRGGHFRDWPGARSFHRDLALAMSRSGRLRMLRVRVDDQIVARQYAVRFGRSMSCRLSARLPGTPWSRFGLGQVSLLRLFERAVMECATSADLGTGTYGYKRRLGGTEHPVRSMVLTPKKRRVKRMVRRFLRAADLLDKAYYKVWFRRIAPRLPGARRPLAKTWIRTRF